VPRTGIGLVRRILVALAAASGWLLSGCGGSAAYPLPKPTIATLSLPDGTTGAEYAQTIEASSGTAPFTWNVSSGSLPNGLALGASSSRSVTLSGAPDTAQANVAFAIQITDAAGQTASQNYVVSINGTVRQTRAGDVQGALTGGVLAFRGIPYADPPVGALRWKPPQSPTSWAGTRDASTFGSICTQLDISNQPVGTEDCLFLNVFVASQTPHGELQPVMVYLHGGSNRTGSTHTAYLDAPPLSTQGVIVVTVEYRLGLLGFFVHPLLDAESGGSSGNYGLMDQIAALSWVQQNIASFGGDPAHVMVFGQSAGSFDVQALLASPLTAGLFSAAGMESSALLHGQTLKLPNLEALDAPLVATVGCDTATDVLACLRAAPASTIVESNLTIPFLPSGLVSRALVIEPHVLPVDPFDALEQHGAPVPLLIGSTREEESAATAADDPTAILALSEVAYEAALHADFDQFGVNAEPTVLAFYPASTYDAPVYALIAAESDAFDITPVRNVARAAAGPNRPAVWRYLYTHRYENDPTLNALRAFHTAELPFVFGSPQLIFGGPYTPSPAELTFTAQLMGYWSRLAKTGNPNGPGAVEWPRYDSSTDAMLQLDDAPSTLIAINGYHNAQCDYFGPLLP